MLGHPLKAGEERWINKKARELPASTNNLLREKTRKNRDQPLPLFLYEPTDRLCMCSRRALNCKYTHAEQLRFL